MHAEFADRAMEMLHKAVKAGYNDADLDPLRGREDFKKLMAEMKAKVN